MLLFVAAAASEIGGAYLLWQALREGAGLGVGAAGAAALVAYGLLASLIGAGIIIWAPR